MSRYDPARDCFTSDPAPVHHEAEHASSEHGHDEHASSDHEQEHEHEHEQAPTHDDESSSPAETRKRPAASSSPASTRQRDPAPSSPSSSSPAQPRKREPTPDAAPRPITAASLPKIRKRRPGETAPSTTFREPAGKYLYNDPPPPIFPRVREEDDPTPPPSRRGSPPRKRKKPGAASRLSEREKEALKEAAEKRESEKRREVEEREKREAEDREKRRVQEQVRSHYNEKRELGKTWRQTSSRIKGLRSFNNWVKSTLIQKFSPADGFDPRRPSSDPNDHLVVLDMGCGKGGDLLKWKSAPQEVGFYLGLDHADVSIAHARDRYDSMQRDARRGGGRGGRNARGVFQAEFHALDCWSHTIDAIPIARRIGFDAAAGPGASRMQARWGGSPAGFDVVSMMFCLHYAFETEAKCRTMLRNVAGALKSGGRFIGTIPSSDALAAQVRDVPEGAEHGKQEWGNAIYRVKFTAPPPKSGVFRPSWGWQYNFFLEEAVEEVPEYVVPWEAFRGLAEDFGLELEYKKMFHDVWRDEKDVPEMRQLSERMGVRNRDTGELALTSEEWEATGIYLAFAFRKG
ncbi:mRNA capping enzyme-domain-containing protein [Geopyxis carbonaria]|nr:mRNA capping enzyme-domain-containing protein [Geopyxis carbonaria]